MVERLLLIVGGLAILAASLVTLTGIVNSLAFDDGIAEFDPGLDVSVNNWLSVVATFAGAGAAGLHALLFSWRRTWFAVLAAALAFISFDDLARVHERIGDRIGVEQIETAIFLPLYAAVFLISWGLSQGMPARIGRFVRIGIMVLLSAVVVDLGSKATRDLTEEGVEWPHATRVAIEEGLEVGGWILVGGALTLLLFQALLSALRGEASARREIAMPAWLRSGVRRR